MKLNMVKKGLGGGLIVSIVGSRLRGPEFDSCSLQPFSREPAILNCSAIAYVTKVDKED